MKLTKSKRELLRKKFDGRCGYCGGELPIRGWHAESIGTEHVAGGLVTVCRDCRVIKGSACISGFRAILSEQVQRAHRQSVNFRTALRYGLVEEAKTLVVFWFETRSKHHYETQRVVSARDSLHRSVA